MILLNDNWDGCGVQSYPYKWAKISQSVLFKPLIIDSLMETFPEKFYKRLNKSERKNEKSYKNYSRQITTVSGEIDTNLPELWLSLIKDIMSMEYRCLVAKFLQQPVAKRLEIRLVKHMLGDWVGPHTDRADKLFTHIIYFNPQWHSSWGGVLDILSDENEKSVVSSVVPLTGTSVLFERSDNSWHQVSRVSDVPINPEKLTVERKSLLIHGLIAR